MAILKGTIKRVVTDRGFGFIESADGNAEYFFHMSALRNAQFTDLREGQSVDFRPATSPKGPRAEDIYVGEGNAL